MGLVIDHEICVLCGACKAACPSGALEIADQVVLNEENCILCGACKDACPVGAITLKKEETAVQKTKGGVWVAVQQLDGFALPVAFELLGKARILADKLGEKLSAVVIGKSNSFAQDLIEAGADVVLCCNADWLGDTDDAAYAAAMLPLIKERRPEIILFGATILGRSAAPRIAAALKTGLTADCTALTIEDNALSAASDPQADPGSGITKLLAQTRPALGGNLMATIVCPGTRPQMATVRPGVFQRPEPDKTRIGKIEVLDPGSRSASCMEILSLAEKSNEAGIADAEVLLVAGRGIGSQKNLKLVKELAERMGAQYGVSRPLIDMGWAQYPHQVGQTGASVAPKLLISLGVSGAIQHLAGIGGAKTVVAVNTDESAPIMKRADYVVQMDCVEFVKEMLRLC